MSKKVDLQGKEYDDLSFDDKNHLYDRGKLPADWTSRFEQELNTPATPPQTVAVPQGPKPIDEMGKKELLAEAESRGVKHPKNISYEKLLSLLQEDADDEDEDDDEETDDDDEDSDEDDDSEDDEDEDDE